MDIIDFDTIEDKKENIEPLKEGRSATALKELYSIPHNELKQQQLKERTKIEEELENLEELDDPIQPYLDYIQWIKTNYPSGKKVESGLIQVLERCTSQFRDFECYKNDPRYLKVWLTYAKYSDNPRDIFVYLARKEIGISLALYYEEYANFLETNNRYTQTEQVYQEGINIKARPFARLQRRFEEFKLRSEERPRPIDEPNSPVFPVRSALALKSGSLFTAHSTTQPPKKKLEIFNDEELEGNLRSEGWDLLGAEDFRNKENRLEARPWAGEVLKQEYNSKKLDYKKVRVFSDENGLLSGPVYKIIELPGKKPEKVDLNFELLYQKEEELCVQEVLARLRGLNKSDRIFPTTLSPSIVPNVMPNTAKENKKQDNDSTIHLSNYNPNRPASPTATFFTNAAKDEVYSMFSQKPIKEGPKHDEEIEQVLIYDDFTEQLTRPNLNDLTEKVSDIDLRRRFQGENSKYPKNSENDGSSIELATVDPADESLKKALLNEVKPSISSYKGLFEYEEAFDMCSTLKKSLNSKLSKQVFLKLSGSESTFNLRSLLGEGGFASVYLAESMNGQLRAIKAQKPSSAWEYYILKQIDNRLKGSDILRSIITCEEIHLFRDESYLVLEYEDQGTILDIVNLFRSTGRNVDEVLVIFLTIEIMKVIEAIHNIGIMHGDLKPDNCMVRLESSDIGVYKKNGLNSWSKKGIRLIDFGRSIDMTLFPDNIKFKSTWKTDNQDCPEMRNNEVWTYQADYYGVAGIIHTMLYGSFIETVLVDGKYKLGLPMKRYWHQELWNPLFDVLINSADYGALPITNKIKEQRERLEDWLEINGSSLSAIIRDIETGIK